MPEDNHLIFSKCHSELVVGVLDIVHSTEITMPLVGIKIDEFYTIFLQETANVLRSHGATVLKNIGDGILFYFPKTVLLSAESFEEVARCGKALISAREEINKKLAVDMLPMIEYRVSMSLGTVSAMLGSEGAIIDLFGSVINTCAKMNKMAKPNTCIVGDALREKLEPIGIALEKIADYKVGETLSFGLWEIAQ